MWFAPLSAMGIDQTGTQDVRMIRALHKAAVFTAIINPPPNLSHHVELGRVTVTADGRTRQPLLRGKAKVA
ncbi:hypothetical protein [Amycolatopsis sp. WAC 01376]|uniref:hypothetical protein n=1 Tax=Amycolatopsis sp. WAC 01376 TaxID=2203195 RepID=UPI000F76C2C1|nr:hypothetical protein [Amycolatopsis sp. WAC 01376]